MVGLDLPVVSMQHQYLVTEAIPAIEAHGRPLPLRARPGRVVVSAPGARGAAARAVRVGLPARLGRRARRRRASAWSCSRTISSGSSATSRMRWRACRCSRAAGLTRVINGPIPYTPDGNPLLGPAFGLENFYLACAFSFGIVQAGGAGKAVGRMDRRGRAGMGPVGARWAPLHGLCDPGLRARPGARALPARICDRLSVRGAGRGAAGPDHAAVSDARRQGGEVRRARRLGAGGVVRAEGCARPSSELTLRARPTGMPRSARSAVRCASGSACSISAASPSSRSSGARGGAPCSTG